jgi:predicted transcriptional regulator
MTLADRIAAEQRTALTAAADATLRDPAAVPASAVADPPTWDDVAHEAWRVAAIDRLRADLRARYCAGPVNRVG